MRHRKQALTPATSDPDLWGAYGHLLAATARPRVVAGFHRSSARGAAAASHAPGTAVLGGGKAGHGKNRTWCEPCRSAGMHRSRRQFGGRFCTRSRVGSCERGRGRRRVLQGMGRGQADTGAVCAAGEGGQVVEVNVSLCYSRGARHTHRPRATRKGAEPAPRPRTSPAPPTFNSRTGPANQELGFENARQRRELVVVDEAGVGVDVVR